MAKNSAPPSTTNAEACEASLRALDLDESDAALVQSQRTIAAALDDGSRNSQLFKEYREGWRDLVADHDEEGDVTGVLTKIRDAAQTRKGDVRARAG